MSTPAEREAVCAARERQSFVRHELRAPLAVMEPLVSLLLSGGAGALTDAQQRHLETLDRSLTRLEGMIASVAASGWFDCCATERVVAPVPLGELVEELAAAHRLSGNMGPRLETSLAEGLEPALVDRDEVRQILANLVDNALRFTPRAGGVTIATEAATAGSVCVLVSDTGPGIPEDERECVTGFGVRGKAAADARLPGLGLGLWVARLLTERNSGRLEVAAAVPAGTAVRVLLPASR